MIMGWQILTISQPARLTLKHKQCVLFLTEKQEEVVVSLDNLSAVILESPAVTLTSALLQEFSTQQIVIFTCNASHLPNGILLPYMPYFAFSKMAHKQITWSEPFKKRLWQKIIKAKILNQAHVLRQQYKTETAEKLTFMANDIQTGDEKNVEGKAAALYWRTLFGQSFSRGHETFINSALNYGYAILRGVVARTLAGNGFIHCFGVHHCNQLNAFNLADDLMEPLRPLVDAQVLQMELRQKAELLPEQKRQLLALLVSEFSFDGQKRSLLNICEQISNSLALSTEQKDFRLLKLFYYDT